MPPRHNILTTMDLARLIILHWSAGEPADLKTVMHAVMFNRARQIVDLRGAYLREEDVAPLWDMALSLAQFTAFSCNLKIPKAEKAAA